VVQLGERVRRARERVGLNQRQLAALTGISQPTISRVESGERSALVVTELYRIAMATGTTVTALTSEADRGEVRRAYQLGYGPLAEVEDLIGQLTGVDVAYRDLGGASGFCAVDPDRGTAIV
jgi:transcriptional regulator with XRE-family HTH domain